MTNTLGTRRTVKHAGAMSAFLLLALFFGMFALPVASFADNSQNQMELTKQACDEYKAADTALNRFYRTILRDYAGDRAFIAAIKKAQTAWIQYRDAHVASIFPGNATEYGSVNPMCRCQVMTEMTMERVQLLKQWVDGAQEGDVCAGSIKVKRSE